MLRFYFVRHGETEGNKEGFFRGRCDYPLNENGLKQAKEVAYYLKELDVLKIYSSPLKRAYQTAKAINEFHNLDIKIDEGFNNLYFSSWEGKPKAFIKQNFPDLWEKWIKNPEDLKVGDSETIDSVGERAKKRLDEIVNEIMKSEFDSEESYNQKTINIIIVSHRVVIKSLFAKILNIPKPYFWKIHVDNASVSIIDYYKKTGYMLYKLNVNHYLSSFVNEIY